MQTPNSALRRPTAGKTVERIPTICVVDAQSNDYCGWDKTADASGARMVSVGTAAEALRLARSQRVDLWVINGELPGLSGYELCRMLKLQSPHAAVYLVTDEYCTAHELNAWRAGATLYACKPGHAQLLPQWLSARTAKSEF